MGTIREQISYLRGLEEGLRIDESSNEGKILKKIIEILDNMAEEIEELQADYDELYEYVESLDEDLSELESDYYDLKEDEDVEERESVFSVECPDCHEIVYVDEELLEGKGDMEIYCPNCKKVVFTGEMDGEQADELRREENDQSASGILKL